MPDSFVREAVRGNNRFLLRIAVVAAIGGFLFGYDTGIISGAQLYITKDLHASQLEQQWLVGALLIGAVVGAALSGWLSDSIGRKWTKIGAGTVT
jgi:MFS family permease